MPENPPKRRSIRPPAYDYAQGGAYFVTVCTQGRICLFGDVLDGMWQPTELGEVARLRWQAIPEHFPHVTLDAFVVMPNHVHGILWLRSADRGAGKACLAPTFSGRRPGKPPARALSSIVGSFKSAVIREINRLRNTPGITVWQRNYYEHVIRNEEDLLAVRRYIRDNPARWHEDEEHPERIQTGAREKHAAPSP